MTKICLLHISTFSKSTFEPWLNWNDRTKSIFKSQKSEFIFLSCVRRVTNRGFKPLQCLSRHISRSAGWIRNWVDKSCCMWRGGLLQKQLDCVINALAMGPLADCVESLRKKKLKTKCLVWCETCRQRSWHNMRGMKILLGVSWSTLAEFQPTCQSNTIGTIMVMEEWPLQIWSLRTQVVQTALQAENPSQMAVPLQNTLPLPLLGAALLPSQPTAENNNHGPNQRLQLLTAVKGGKQRRGPGSFPANITRKGDFSSLFCSGSCPPRRPGSPAAPITRRIVGVFLSLLDFYSIQFELLWKDRISAGLDFGFAPHSLLWSTMMTLLRFLISFQDVCMLGNLISCCRVIREHDMLSVWSAALRFDKMSTA